MSADTFTTAIFLITAVIAASVLVSAIFPVVYQMSGTFAAAGHAADQQIRTNVQIILPVAYNNKDPNYETVWIKNTGNRQISTSEIAQADIFCGDSGNFKHMTIQNSAGTLTSDYWTYTSYFANQNSWAPGETLEVVCYPSTIISTTNQVYFQFVLPDGISTSDQFTVSTAP
ncbi:flagellin [Methanoregula sp.]|uniref:flagellin n=1 Tax=Methanoregula sp. TaxID=2052170 RepID=UPI002CEAB5E5|nr:flagellin [Methanoregula sp.]HVP96166.1 flagellin [Methanoregula sp.]